MFFCLFVCILGGGFRPIRDFSTHMETSLLPVKGCKFFHLCSALMAIEHSIACHTFCNTWHRFIMVISEDPWHSHLMLSIWKWSCHYLFSRLVCRGWDSNTHLFACEANALTHCTTAAVGHNVVYTSCSKLSEE